MKKIVAFFGAFNPPTYGHISFAEQVLEADKNIEKILFVPVNSKYQKRGLIENEHRYNMLECVCKNNSKFSVSSIELECDRAMYTFETLRILKKQYLDKQICFAIGSDNLKEIHIWKKSEELLGQYEIYVAQRKEDNINKIIESNKLLKKYEKSFNIISKIELTKNISSTLLRENIEKKKSINSFTLKEISNYIKLNKLYVVNK